MLEYLYYSFLLIFFLNDIYSFIEFIRTISGGIIGAITAWFLSYMNSRNEFNNNKKGVNAYFKI